ncbi:MAG: hypothetical protein ACRDOK_02485 [Streptosporangiaceae bacterium]
MAGGRQPQAGGDVRERAETYLRLLAESTLRRALTSPPIPRPGHGNASLPLRVASRVLPPAAGLAGRAVRPLDPVVRRVLATREHVQGRALPAARPAARWTVGAASGLAAAVPTSARAAERASWQVRRMLRGSQRAGRSHRAGPVREGLDQVGRLASDFAAADLIDLADAESIVDGLESAMAARSRLETRGPGWAMRRRIRQQPVSHPAGPVRAIPLGRAVSAPSEDGPVHVTLLALVLATDWAEVTLTGRLAGAPNGGPRQLHRNWSEPLSGSASDDRGVTYQAHFAGGWGKSRIDGALSFHPVPPPGAQWLDVKVGESDPVRVQLAGSQPAPAELIEDENASAIEHFIDSRAERLLSHLWLPGAGDGAAAPGALAALREIGAVSPASPALRRLAALLRRLGSDPPEVGDVPSSDLPEPWASVLDCQDATDGPTGVSPLAVAFPEIDGTRCVLTGLRSEPDSASLQLVCWGWTAPGWQGLPGETTWPSIWARDNAGRWHIAADDGGSFGGGHANVTLRLTPPVHPDATTLEIALIGKSARAVATVPLAWQDQP